MSRRTEMVCAAALLLAAAGCSASSFLLSWASSGGKKQVVSGSVNDVAARLQASLGKINIIVATTPMDDGTIKLNGQTKSGKRFSLILKRQATSSGENTAVSVEWWQKDADEEFWAIVLDLLLKPEPTSSGTTASAAGGNISR
jgi:hypothetical protein